jgi:hypothetical protein
LGGTCSTRDGGKKCIAYAVLEGESEGKDSMGDLGVDGRIILKRTLENKGLASCSYRIEVPSDRTYRQTFEIVKTVFKRHSAP